MIAINELTDGELLEVVRAGNELAYGILFSRHKDAALRVARRQTPDGHLAEDAVNEAFAAVLAAIHGGAGPVGIFGPYLFSSVSRTVYRMNRLSMRETPVQDTELPDVSIPEMNSIIGEFDNSAAREAFKGLPARWREVLWYMEIEEMRPREAAPLLGLSPNATVALHRRAKDGLRLGYLQQHVTANGHADCRKMAANIPAYVLGMLSQSKKTALELHLETCDKCGAVLLQIQDMGALRAAILPVLAIFPLSQIYPSDDPQTPDPEAKGRKRRDALLTGFVAFMITSALLLGFASFQAPTSAEQGQLPRQSPETPTPGPSPTHPTSHAAQFDVLSHSGNQAIATLELQLPDRPTSLGRVTVDPGSGHSITWVTADPSTGWTCTITTSGTAECRSPAVRASTLLLTLEMDRPPCPSGTPVSLLVSLNNIDSLRQSWESPCASS